MFEVGRKYTFEFLDARDDNDNPDLTSLGGREVLAIDGPLIKIRDIAGDFIVNTHSPIFFRATESKSK